VSERERRERVCIFFLVYTATIFNPRFMSMSILVVIVKLVLTH
jgi:hypothetical protein